MVDIQHMICRYPNITAPAFPLPVSILKVCANIDVPHRCLSNEESESGDDVPISCQWVRHLDWRPSGKRLDKPHELHNLFHHEVGVARRSLPICYAHISSCSVIRDEGMHC